MLQEHKHLDLMAKTELGLAVDIIVLTRTTEVQILGF